MRTIATAGLGLALAVLLAACGGPIRVLSPDEFCAECQSELPYEREQTTSQTQIRQFESGQTDGGILSFISRRDGTRSGGAVGNGTGVAVNSVLWRASLDTLGFIPLSQADPFGGVILSEWYSPPNITEERFKVSVYILGTELRTDGVEATVHKQTLDERRGWVDALVDPSVSVSLENAILTRAREIRIGGR